MVWGQFSDRERSRAVYMCSGWNPSSILMLSENPLGTVWPPCGFNPIYKLLLVTKHRFPPSLKKEWPQYKGPGIQHTTATDSPVWYYFFSLLPSTLIHTNWKNPARSQGQCAAQLMRCGFWCAGESPQPLQSKWSLTNHCWMRRYGEESWNRWWEIMRINDDIAWRTVSIKRQNSQRERKWKKRVNQTAILKYKEREIKSLKDKCHHLESSSNLLAVFS